MNKETYEALKLLVAYCRLGYPKDNILAIRQVEEWIEEVAKEYEEENMNYVELFNRAYLKQQNVEYTEENAENYGLHKDNLKELFNNEKYVIVLNQDDQAGDFLNLIYKQDYKMETIEIG